MSDKPTINAPDACATIEMQTDGTGIRFAIEPSAKYIFVQVAIDWDLEPAHYEEVIGHLTTTIRAYDINSFEAEEVIAKMRMVIACYDAIKAQNERERA